MGFLWCPHCGKPHALNTLRCPAKGLPIAIGVGRAQRALAERGSLIAKRYQVLAFAGSESVAELYTARHLATGRVVLVKVVHDDELPREERAAEMREMEREAVAASRIEHPNVAPVLDFERLGEAHGFLVREQHSTAKLAQGLRAAGALDVADVADILSQILSGLSAIDMARVVHRDLATHNIFMEKRAGCRPHVKIAGLGRCSGPKLPPQQDPPSGVHYASPECLAGGPADHRSDLFSCGVILFEMLTGRRPFEAVTADAVRLAILRSDRPAASDLAPHLGKAWHDVIEKALSQEPGDRFQSARAFQRALPTHVRPSARVLFLAESSGEHVALTDTMLGSEGPRSRPGAFMGSKCDPFIGRRIGNGYALETLLGTGSAGAVYKAVHTRLKRPVAVKILHDRHRASRQFVDRFKAEALVACRLDHPNVTRILDCGEEPDGSLYLVMEYLEGQSLETVIEAEGFLPQVRAANIAIQVLSSLVVAHAAGIVHRDVKPENIILLRDRGEDGMPVDLVKVCDFGIAKLATAGPPPEGGGRGTDLVADDDPTPELTTPGLLLGSPLYMAPEQIRSNACDERTDIYAAAATLFQMLTGRLPHEAETLHELFHKKLNERPAPPTMFNATIDPLLEDIVLRGLEAEPHRRHPSASEMRSEIVEALKELGPPPTSNKTMSIWPDRPDAPDR